MQRLGRENLIEIINNRASCSIPFVVIVDFKGDSGYIFEINELSDSGISLNIEGVNLGRKVEDKGDGINLYPKPISKELYYNSFNKVKSHIYAGDTYLLNLTMATELEENICLESIYCNAKARYKFLFKDRFVFYSPETFVKISDNKIFSYPMKGTINSDIEGAENRLMGDKKELYEHYTIVDLIRNDLSIISKNVTVTKFRYIDNIKTSFGGVLQTSSEIVGELDSEWKSRLGDILFKMLPAGSVSGAPKEKTVEIIEECEYRERGFYTGIMGYFDGKNFNSAVSIRYIERDDRGNYVYNSGGGLTFLSDAEEEYNELKTKIYVPIL